MRSRPRSKMTDCISACIGRALCRAAFVFSYHSLALNLNQTIVSKTEIPAECRPTYQAGIELLRQQVESKSGLTNLSEYGPKFDAAYAEYDSDDEDDQTCAFFFSMGLL